MMGRSQESSHGEGVRAGSGPAGGVRVAICGPEDKITPAAEGLGDVDPTFDLRVLAIGMEAGSELPLQSLLDTFPSVSRVVILADDASDVSEPVRIVALLAYRLTGAAPILALAGTDSGAAQAWADFAQDLGIPPADRLVVDARPGSTALRETVSRLAGDWRARCDRDAALRFWIADAGGATPSATIEGELIAGRAMIGQEVVLLPSATSATITAVTPLPNRDRAIAPRLALTLDLPAAATTDRVLSSAGSRPEQADQIVAHIVWLGRKPMLPGRTYVARLGTQTTRAQIGTLKHRVHPTTLEPMAARRLAQGDVGLCNVAFTDPLVFDPSDRSNPSPQPMSRFILEDAIDGTLVGRGEIVFTLRRATNIHWQALSVDKSTRASLKGQRPACLWFTGLSGSGKSTIATGLDKRLTAMGLHTYTLDGDNVRHGLNRDLGFTDADRVENIRRIAEVAKLFVDAGLLVMVSFISPFRAERRMARSLLGPDEFLEIFVDTPIEVCEQRDPKGLYRKARAGQLKNFTGIDSPYEPPEHAEIRVAGGDAAPDVLVERVLADLKRRGLV